MAEAVARMTPEDFLRAFLQAPESAPVADGVAFLDVCLRSQDHRDLLVAWLAAASRGGLLPNAATMLLQALVADHPPRALAGAESAVNIVGTGGGLPTFNISTAAAFVAAACGVPVLKTGSHAYSSRCGALDVLAHLGVLWHASRDDLSESLNEFGVAFVPQTHYSPRVRALVARLAPLSVRTAGRLLNLIGPLLCPYRVAAQVTGVAEAAMLEPYAEAVRANSGTPMWIVHALCGMDELCSLSENRIVALSGAPQMSGVVPAELGCVQDAGAHAEAWPLAGAANPKGAAAMIESVLAGHGHSVQAQTVALNAAAAIHVAGARDSFAEAYRLALDALADGAPAAILQRLKAAAQRRHQPRHQTRGGTVEASC